MFYESRKKVSKMYFFKLKIVDLFFFTVKLYLRDSLVAALVATFVCVFVNPFSPLRVPFFI